MNQISIIDSLCRIFSPSFLPFGECVIRVFLAVILGGMIGFERGKHGRAAGLRTHMLVCLGSAVSSMCGIYMTTIAGLGDPSRIASGVVSGIGFLGAGMILVKNTSKVTGLTTAAAMWATSTIGLAVGAGFYSVAIIGGITTLVITTFMTVLEISNRRDKRFYIEIDDATKVNRLIGEVRAMFKGTHSADVIAPKSGIGKHVGISINIPDTTSGTAVLNQLLSLDGVVFALVE